MTESAPPSLSTSSVSTNHTTSTSATVHSDTLFAPPSDRKSVMAEQSSHNVVEKPQSTSGLPLVDAAANQTTTIFAERGTYTRPITKPSSDSQEFPNSAGYLATGSDPAAWQAESEAAKDTAEPSAGDAANKSAQDPTYDSLLNEASYNGVTHAQLIDGVVDDASQEDGPVDDRSTADISVDVSVNSDTENSKLDFSEKKDGNHHVRTNSVKKPTTFSKITATKNFMSKVAPTAPVAPKVGEKPSPVSAVLQQSSKPRLVAKTGASLANLQKSRLGAEGTGSPDASKVWNKNRPAPQPTPRALTDEELKQQYGIHLATRLQSEENGKESKWADIDDDEEDWAPDTVVWMDGTKSTLTPQDAVVSPQAEQKEQKPSAPLPPRPADGIRPTLALKQRSDMKILKPGSAAAQIKSAGPSSTSPSLDKVSLRVKSPAPAPSKSPWAPVPKVDSVSPINPPIQQPQAAPKLAPQDARVYEPPQAPPAREIAADTFDRSWNEGEGGARELFNSTNGRYEPAPEGRRGSVKPDGGFRKPAVLQRPSQSSASPAEPSAAFQSRTTSQMDGGWGRRRGSSVSQGSLPPARRMSTNQRPDLAQTPEVAVDVQSPATTRGEYVRPTFSQQSTWDQQMPPRPEVGPEPTPPTESAPLADPGIPAEDPVKIQERVMREKRELARKRRQEEELHAEAEKQERLKAKLAKLQDAGKSKKEREAEAATAAAAATNETSTSPAEPSAEHSQQADQKVAQAEPARPAQASASTAASLESRTTVPEPAPIQPVQTPPMEKLPAPLPSKSHAAATGLPDRPASSEHAPRQPNRQHLSPKANARAPYQPSTGSYSKTPATSSYSSPGDRKLQPSGFERSPNLGSDAFTPWPTTAPNRNVWGTAGIGNGTFESSSAFAPVPMSQQNSALPPPPGMGRASTSTRLSPLGQESRSPSLQQQQVAEQQRAFPPPGIESRPESFTASQSRLHGMSPAPGAGRPPHPPGPIGPPSRTQQQPQQPHAQRTDAITAWNNAKVNLPAKYASDVAAADAKRKQNTDVPVQASDNRFKETFKKTSADLGKLGAPRRFEAPEYTIHDAQGSRSVPSLSPTPLATQTQPPAPLPSASSAQDPWKQPAENSVRIPEPSRNPAHGVASMHRQPIGPRNVQQANTGHQIDVKFPTMPIPPIIDSKDQSPPPPETANHPVNQNIDINHPQVKLPPPQAKVRLPPMSPSGANHAPVQYNGQVVMPPSQRPQVWGPPGATRPIVMNEAWQARFNGLFNRVPIQAETPPSPPKTPPKMQGPSLAVASSSRTVMREQVADATVSLPRANRIMEFAEAPDTKPSLDEMFKEELSFGSMPKVHVPHNTNYNTSPYSPSARRYLEHTNSQLHRHLDVQTKQDWSFYKSPLGYFVAIPETALHNKLCKVPGAVDPRSKDGERRPSKAQSGNRSWTERKSSHAESRREGLSGASSKDWHERKSAPAQHEGKEWSDRKQASKFNKHKSSNKDADLATPPSAATATPRNESPRPASHQKPTRQPKTAPTEGGDSRSNLVEAAKSDSAAAERKRTGWGNKGPRSNNRNTHTTTALTAPATSIKSS